MSENVTGIYKWMLLEVSPVRMLLGENAFINY